MLPYPGVKCYSMNMREIEVIAAMFVTFLLDYVSDHFYALADLS
jgi:hypothetical protein